MALEQEKQQGCTRSENCPQAENIIRMDERFKVIESIIGEKFNKVYEVSILLQERFLTVEKRMNWITGLLTALLLSVIGYVLKVVLG